MKVILLAGGFGTRLAEETDHVPKPMVEIGSKPLLWHIMNIYSHYDYSDFIVACGYRGEVIKEYFHNFSIHNNDYTFDLRNGKRNMLNSNPIDWRVSVIDTGQNTMTGGRLLRLKSLLEGGRFMVTYGDGLGNIDIRQLLDFHESHGRLATVTAVRPPARFGALHLDGDTVKQFSEKPQTEEGWINGGYFILEPEVLSYISDDNTIFERDPMERLAEDDQLRAYRHRGFWQPMDTLREKRLLESLWHAGRAPWKIWA